MKPEIKNITPYIKRLFFILNRSVLIGIDGRAGTGKTTLAKYLTTSLKAAEMPVNTVLTDDFYHFRKNRWQGPVEKQPVGYNYCWQRLLDEVIIPFKSGRQAKFQLYNWNKDCLDKWKTVDSRGILLIEGFSSTRKELSGYCDLRIWLSCSKAIRENRIKKRGDMSQEELREWRPAEDQYIKAHKSEKKAHIVIDSSQNSQDKHKSRWSVIRWKPPAIS